LDHNRPSTLAELETWSVAMLGNPPNQQDFTEFIKTFVLKDNAQKTKDLNRFLRILLDKNFVRERLLQFLNSGQIDIAKMVLEKATKHGIQLEPLELIATIPGLISDFSSGAPTEELLTKYGSSLIFLVLSPLLSLLHLPAIPVAVGTFGGKKVIDHLLAYNLITKTVSNHLIFMQTVEANLNFRI